MPISPWKDKEQQNLCEVLIPTHRRTCKLTVIYVDNGLRNGRDHLYICEKAEAHPLCTFVSSS